VPLNGISKDNIIRADTTKDKLKTLKPVFDRSEHGTLTAGNSSALTDGASAIMLVSEQFAKNHSLKILGYIEAVEFSAINPSDGLLMAPAIALPNLLKKNNLTVNDLDFIEIHEAFAAQVLANIQVWENGWDKYPELKPIGKIPLEKVNVNGSSIAIGHPFAATGGRLILSALNNLHRTGKNQTAISVCAAGAMACAMLVRRN
jgi:acetyl-CoA acetyltransferase family protein